MKRKRHLLFLVCLAAVSLVVNSCKKQTQSPVQQLFTGGFWELASVTATYYTGNTQDTVITLNTTCDSTQAFIFNANNTCTYKNFDCLPQTSAAAGWTLSQNQLYLQASVVCKDTTATGSSMPFSYAQIVNLGQYSLVLLTGDIQQNYSLTKPRKIIQWGFIRQKLNGSD